MAAGWRRSAAADTCEGLHVNDQQREQMNIVIVGHVDHGKSTVIGRLLADTDSLPHGKLDQVRANCVRNAKPFEYAFLLDALKDEQAQGITIDVARVFFKSAQRDYIIIDAPGHIEFLKNMVTGASRAECALLVIDAAEGIRENSRRHGYLTAMLGIRQLVVLVNKMDLVGYDEKIFSSIQSEYTAFLKEINAEAQTFIPISGMQGENIATLGKSMPWYHGMTVLGALDTFQKEESGTDKAFRMPVQDVYKFTGFRDSRRVVAGTVEAGTISVGDTVVFYPSGKKSKIKSFEAFNVPGEIKSAQAGETAAFTLDEQIYIRRGEVAVKEGDDAPEVSSRLKVSLFWLGRKPMVSEKEYLFKCGTLKIPVKLEQVTMVVDASNLKTDSQKGQVNRHDVAECILKLQRPAAVDKANEYEGTGRFVLVDDYEIAGGGIIREGLEDQQTDIRDYVFQRNYKWEKSFINAERRAERYGQKAHLILITGGKDTGKKKIAKKLEECFFNEGKFVYFLGIGNLLYGVDADIKKGNGSNRKEHIRRLAEVAHLMLDSGTILIVTAVGLDQEELEIIKTVVDPERIETLWVGDKITTDIKYDIHLADGGAAEEAFLILKEKLQEKNVIFKAW